jgi:hypothetical protein
MTGQWWNHKILTLVVAVLACAALAVSIALAFPTQISSPTLGAEWQCHRSAGIMTTCSRVSHVMPTQNRSHTRVLDVRKV